LDGICSPENTVDIAITVGLQNTYACNIKLNPHYKIMRKELAPDCQACDIRPVCELAGLKYQQLERAAAALGYTVTEGSVICGGRSPGSLLLDMDARCGTRLSPPDLASPEEREHISELARLDEETTHVLADAQAIAETLKS